MDLVADLAVRGEHRLALAPRMLQSIEVLQLATDELLQRVELELAHNELLDAAPRAAEWPPASGMGGARAALAPPAGGDADGLLSSLPAAAPSLQDHVREQLLWLDLPVGLRDAVLCLAGFLDERGLLPAADDELRRAVGEQLEPALAVLRSLEPRGIGGRDAIDAMLLQVPPDDPDRGDICALLTEHLAGLAANRLPAVARQMRLEVADVLALCARIRALNPRPGARFQRADLPRIRPDLVVEEAGDRLEVAVDDHALPDLGLNADYTALLAGPHTPPEVRRYLSGKLSAARDLIHAIEQRRRTLARVGAAVMQHQREFLRWGEAALRPLRMADIAAQLGLHTSTVSRAVAGKHVQTCRGIHALRAFFDGGAAGGGCGRRRVLRQLQELVAAEDPQRPLSDDDLVSLLAALSIPVARRTVAKYRQELGLLPSWRRKSHRG